MTVEILHSIYEELCDLKSGKNKTDSGDEDEIEYNCIIIDDFDIKNSTNSAPRPPNGGAPQGSGPPIPCVFDI